MPYSSVTVRAGGIESGVEEREREKGRRMTLTPQAPSGQPPAERPNSANTHHILDDLTSSHLYPLFLRTIQIPPAASGYSQSAASIGIIGADVTKGSLPAASHQQTFTPVKATLSSSICLPTYVAL